MSRFSQLLATAITVSSAFVFVACGNVGEQCQNFIKTANDGMTKVNKKDSSADMGKDAENSAKAMEGVAADVGKLDLKDPQLKKMADDYQAMLKNMAGAMRDMAGVTKDLTDKASDPDALKGLQTKMEDLSKKVDQYGKDESDIVDKLNAYCKDK